MNTIVDVAKTLGAVLDRAEHQAETLTDPAELSVLHEAVSDLIASMERRLVRARALRDRVTARMEQEMGDGEAVVCPSTGRVAYMGPLADGKATVVQGAVNEIGSRLPEHLRPKTYTRYPTVTELRAALKAGDIDRTMFRELVDEPPSRIGLRWRTLDVEDAA